METKINEQRLSEFKVHYLQNKCKAYKAAIAMGMKPASAKANAWRLARAVNLQVREALESQGGTVETVSLMLFRKMKSRNQTISLSALKEGLRILDAYPAEKQTAEPLTINLTVNMEL